MKVTGLQVEIDATKTAEGRRQFQSETQALLGSARDYVTGVGDAFERLQTRIFNFRTGVASVLASLGFEKIISQISQLERIGIALQAATGSSAAARREWDFLERTAERLGVRADDLGIKFARLAAATRGTKLEGAETEKIFNGVTSAVVALGGSTEDTEEVLTGFTRALSRLPGAGDQLVSILGRGGRLPGLANDMAAAVGLSVKTLQRSLREGEIDIDRVVSRTADLWASKYKSAAEKAADTIDGWKNRVTVSLSNLFEESGRGGLRDEFIDLLKQINDALRDPTTIQAANDFGRLVGGGLHDVGVAMKFIADHQEGFRRFVEALLLLKGATFIGGIAGDLRSIGTAVVGNAAGRIAGRAISGVGAGAAAGAGGAAAGAAWERLVGSSFGGAAAAGAGATAVTLAGPLTIIAAGGLAIYSAIKYLAGPETPRKPGEHWGGHEDLSRIMDAYPIPVQPGDVLPTYGTPDPAGVRSRGYYPQPLASLGTRSPGSGEENLALRQTTQAFTADMTAMNKALSQGAGASGEFVAQLQGIADKTIAAHVTFEKWHDDLKFGAEATNAYKQFLADVNQELDDLAPNAVDAKVSLDRVSAGLFDFAQWSFFQQNLMGLDPKIAAKLRSKASAGAQNVASVQGQFTAGILPTGGPQTPEFLSTGITAAPELAKYYQTLSNTQQKSLELSGALKISNEQFLLQQDRVEAVAKVLADKGKLDEEAIMREQQMISAQRISNLLIQGQYELLNKIHPERQAQTDIDRARALLDQKDAQTEINDVLDRYVQAEIGVLIKTRDGWSGAKAAAIEYANELDNVAQGTYTAFQNTFHGLEDTLTQFFATGKISFSGFFQAIAADWSRVLVRQIEKPFFDWIATLGGGFLKSIGGGGTAPINVETNLAPVGPSGLIGTLPSAFNGGITLGTIPFKSYASGGIDYGRTLRLIQTGDRPNMPEAHVPLPDGRSIPVTISGGQRERAPQIVSVRPVIVNSGQAKTAERATSRYDPALRELVVEIVMSDSANNGPMKRGGVIG